MAPLNREELTRCWELEGGNQISDVCGRLKANIDFWRDTLKPAPWILACISNGYKLPLNSIPGPFIGKNQDSAVKNSDFVAEALRELESNRCVERAAPHLWLKMGRENST